MPRLLRSGGEEGTWATSCATVSGRWKEAVRAAPTTLLPRLTTMPHAKHDSCCGRAGADWDDGISTGASNTQPPSKPTKKSAACPGPDGKLLALQARLSAPWRVCSSPIG